MLIVLSYLEILFFPCIALSLIVGALLGSRLALNDSKRALYWKRRAQAAEGQVRRLTKAFDSILDDLEIGEK
jgi:hypothetical protein